MVRRIVIAGLIMFLFQSCISSPPIIQVDTKLNSLLLFEGIEAGKTSDYTKALAKCRKFCETDNARALFLILRYSLLCDLLRRQAHGEEGIPKIPEKSRW